MPRIDRPRQGRNMRLASSIASLLIVIASVSAFACDDLPSQAHAGSPRVAERVEYGVVERIDLYRYRTRVRLDSGARLEVEEVGEGELRIGDHVKVVNSRVFRD